MPEPRQLRDPAHWLRADAARAGDDLELGAGADGDAGRVTLASAGASGCAALRLVMMSGDWIPVSLPDRIRPLAPKAVR